MDETMETVQGDIESAWSAEDPAGEAEGTERKPLLRNQKRRMRR